MQILLQSGHYKKSLGLSNSIPLVMKYSLTILTTSYYMHLQPPGPRAQSKTSQVNKAGLQKVISNVLGKVIF